MDKHIIVIIHCFIFPDIQCCQCRTNLYSPFFGVLLVSSQKYVSIEKHI